VTTKWRLVTQLLGLPPFRPFFRASRSLISIRLREAACTHIVIFNLPVGGAVFCR